MDRLIEHGMSPDPAAAKQTLLTQCIQALNHRPLAAAVYVPGRIEFLGKHTDYCGGRSLICAIDKGIILAASLRDDSNLRIIETATGEQAIISPAAQQEIPPGHWSNYPATVLRRVTQNFPGLLRGADIAIASDLPLAAGLSSSSALVIGIFLILSQINHLTRHPEYQSNIHTPEDLAGYLGTIENGQTFGTLTGDRGVGTFGGSQDHTAILCCRANFLSQYRFTPVVAERVISFPRDYTLIVAVSGVVAEKTGEAKELYNQLSLRAQEVLQIWNTAKSRSDPTLAAATESSSDAADQIRALISKPAGLPLQRQADSLFKPDLLLARFNQFLEESTRIIPRTSDALAAHDFPSLGKLVDRSQYLAEHQLRNQVPETIFLASSARALGATAASAFGAGFGGSVWAMIPAPSANIFLNDWRTHYTTKFPSRSPTAKFFVTRPCIPAMMIT